MNLMTIASTDINPKRVRDSDHFNRVRKAWVLQINETSITKLKKVPGEARLQLYKMFDAEITDLWIAEMSKRNEHAVKSNAKLVNIDGYHHFEDSFLFDTNQVLIEVASIWLDKNLTLILANEAQ